MKAPKNSKSQTFVLACHRESPKSNSTLSHLGMSFRTRILCRSSTTQDRILMRAGRTMFRAFRSTLLASLKLLSQSAGFGFCQILSKSFYEHLIYVTKTQWIFTNFRKNSFNRCCLWHLVCLNESSDQLKIFTELSLTLNYTFCLIWNVMKFISIQA